MIFLLCLPACLPTCLPACLPACLVWYGEVLCAVWCVYVCVFGRLRVRSRMWDACIVVDGTHSFTFNDGALLDIDMNEHTALRCLQLDT